MARMRFGIIGAGGIARAHAAALRALPETAELVAVCDTLPEAAERLGRDFSVPAHGGQDALQRLLARPDIDAVSIATPSGLHHAQALAALESGRHVLSEKPLAVTLEQADEMIVAQRRTGRALGGIFQHRYDAAAAILREAITSGRMGRILHANAYLKWYRTQAYYDAGGWRGSWEMDGGGALMNQSVHYVDLLQWLSGGVTAVKAYAETLHHRIATEDAAVAAIRLQGGGLGTIEGMTNAVANGYDRVEIYGTDGMGVIEGGTLTRYFTRAEAITPTPEDPRPSQNLAGMALERFAAAHPGWEGGHRAVFAGFVEAVGAGREPPVPAHEARRAVEIVLAVYRSAREGGEVRIG